LPKEVGININTTGNPQVTILEVFEWFFLVSLTEDYQVDDAGFIVKGSGNSTTKQLLLPNEGEELSHQIILKGR